MKFVFPLVRSTINTLSSFGNNRIFIHPEDFGLFISIFKDFFEPSLLIDEVKRGVLGFLSGSEVKCDETIKTGTMVLEYK